jgi:glycosyltransferase involved in cell wall biosynthesis
MKEPLVTVLMPVYNGEAYLRYAIQSILDQTYTDFVFLIINDGSTDGSEEIILSFDDCRIQYVKNETNLKLVKTLNKGLSLIKTKYVARMDADDISLPERLERQLFYMEQNPDVGLLGTWCKTFEENRCIRNNKDVNHDQEISHEQICFKQLYQIQLVHPTCMMRMSVLENIDNWYDENYLHAEDYELFTRMSHVTKLANIAEVLHLYRKHGNAVSVLNNKEQNKNSYKVIKREFCRLGIEITDLQIETFTALNYQAYSEVKLSVLDIRQLLEKMVLANKISNYFEDVFLFERLSSLWLSYCYETHMPISMYNNSSLARSIPMARKLKWFVKNCLYKVKGR